MVSPELKVNESTIRIKQGVFHQKPQVMSCLVGDNGTRGSQEPNPCLPGNSGLVSVVTLQNITARNNENCLYLDERRLPTVRKWAEMEFSTEGGHRLLILRMQPLSVPFVVTTVLALLSAWRMVRAVCNKAMQTSQGRAQDSHQPL